MVAMLVTVALAAAGTGFVAAAFMPPGREPKVGPLLVAVAVAAAATGSARPALTPAASAATSPWTGQRGSPTSRATSRSKTTAPDARITANDR